MEMNEQDTIFVQEIDSLREEFHAAREELYINRFYHYAYILDRLVQIVDRYTFVFIDVENDRCFDLRKLVGMKYEKLDKANWLLEIDEKKRDEIDEIEYKKYSNFSMTSCYDFSLSGSLKKIFKGERTRELCESNLNNVVTCIDDIKEGTNIFEAGILQLIKELRITIFKINYELDKKQSSNLYVQLMDYLIEMEGDYEEEMPFAVDIKTGEYWNMYLIEYCDVVRGYLDKVSKTELENVILWEFVGEFLETGFFDNVRLATCDRTQMVLKAWDKVKDKKGMEGKEEDFIKFNYFFVSEGGRYALDKERMAKYIIKFAQKLTYKQVASMVDFCRLLETIYEDMDNATKPKEENPINMSKVIEGFVDLMSEIDKQGKLADGVTVEKLRNFIERVANDNDESAEILRARLIGTKNTIRIKEVSAKNVDMLIGVLSKMGYLRIDKDDIERYVKRENIKGQIGTWLRFFDGGLNRTKKWTEKGGQKEKKSEAVYDYIETVAQEVLGNV